MMDGNVVLELTSADIPAALRATAQAGITLFDVQQRDDLTVRLCIRRQDMTALSRLAERRGESIKQIRRLGVYWRYRRLWNHPVLLVGIMIMVIATVYLPMKVLFIQVEGNAALPTQLILEKAEECGIAFGADRGVIRSEKVKNALLDAVPQLQWAGINTTGCVATITVRERRETVREETIAGIASIVAARDGVIRECTVSRGKAVCKVGQAVQAGEVLISGYTDCGIAILSCIAEGEVYAETNRQLWAVTTEKATVRGDEAGGEIKFSLLIGKNRINFYEDSGILDATCVKMVSEYKLTLPGGFQLPVTLVREEWTWYNCREAENSTAEETLRCFAPDYMTGQMLAGQILSQQETVDGCALYGNYICLEMIGQIRYEEIIDEYGKDYGENSERGTR